MKIIPLLFLALLLTVPAAMAAGGADRGRVFEEYRAVLVTDTDPGLGVEYMTLEVRCFLAYDAPMPDSDPVDASQTVSSVVALSCTGPGSDVFSGIAAPTITVSSPDPAAACVTATVSSGSGVSARTRYVSIAVLASFSAASLHPEKCSLMFTVAMAGASEAWQLRIPVTLFNDDAEQSRFQQLFGITGDEASALLVPLMLLLAVVVLCGPNLMRYALATLLILMGLLILWAGTGLGMLLVGFFAFTAGGLRLVMTILEDRPERSGPFQGG